MNKLSKRIKLLQKLNKDTKFNKFLKEIVVLFKQQISNNHAIYTAGNGGSHSDADHLTGELLGRFKRNRRPFNSECLSGATSGVISCIANDFGWEETIARQLDARYGIFDVFVCFSTSGDSVNIVKALELCKEKGITSIAFLGKDGGQAKKLATYSYIVPSNETAIIQEIHTTMIHLICEELEDEA